MGDGHLPTLLPAGSVSSPAMTKGSPRNSAGSYSPVGQKQELLPISEPFPENIYGAGMAHIVQSAATHFPPVHRLTAIIGLAILSNIALQVFMLYCIRTFTTWPAVMHTRRVYGDFHAEVFVDDAFSQDAWDSWDSDRKDELCQFPLSQPLFCMAILIMWTLNVTVDVKETLVFWMWWAQLPCCTTSHVTFANDEYERGEEEPLVVSGASCWVKACIYGFILLPKLAIALLLWWLGARWLVATNNFENLICNSVALAFITDLDERLFKGILPHGVLKMEGHFQIQVEPPSGGRDMKLRKFLQQMVLKAFVVVALPYLYITYLQQVLPGYKFDVREHCTRYLARRDI